MKSGAITRARRRMWAPISLLAVLGIITTGCSTPPDVVETVTVTPSASSTGAPGVTVPSVNNEVPGSGQTVGSQLPPVESTGLVPRQVTITSNPEFGAKKLAPNTPVTVTVFNAEIKDLVLVAKSDGTELSGKIAEDGATWTLTDRMAYGTEYSYRGSATSVDGVETPIKGKLTTVNPETTMRAAFQIGEGQEVGVAAPIVLTFAGHVEDRAAAEKTFSVTLNGKPFKGGSWGWLQDEDISGEGVPQSRVHFRPEKYWPAYSDVTVEANLYGVNLGGSWGREDIFKNFTIGRKQVVKADVNSFRLVVYVDDEIKKNYPVSYGSLADPDRATRSGIHVVQETFESFDMCNERFGYCGVKAPWAVRISNNGEFIHVNETTEKAGVLGKENVSHGCVNMGMADGKDFYDSVLYGDPVEVINPGAKKLSPQDGDIFDWAIPYSEWKTYSAL